MVKGVNRGHPAWLTSSREEMTPMRIKAALYTTVALGLLLATGYPLANGTSHPVPVLLAVLRAFGWLQDRALDESKDLRGEEHEVVDRCRVLGESSGESATVFGGSRS